MLENNRENRYGLAQHVIDSMDLKDVLVFAVETLYMSYEEHPDVFEQDAESYDIRDADDLQATS